MEASIPRRDKGVSSLENISEAEASILSIGHPRVEGAFVFVSPLFILSSYIPSLPHPHPLASLHPFHRPRSFEREWRGSTEPARKSIMKLFKFVSNIEISFMPGKLIIEIYRRTRSWPGSRGMIFLFFARPLFPLLLGPSGFHSTSSRFARTSVQTILSCLVNSFRSISPIHGSTDTNPRIGGDSSP